MLKRYVNALRPELYEQLDCIKYVDSDAIELSFFYTEDDEFNSFDLTYYADNSFFIDKKQPDHYVTTADFNFISKVLEDLKGA